MGILSNFDIFAQILKSSGMPQSEHYASKSAGYCLYTIYISGSSFLQLKKMKFSKVSKVPSREEMVLKEILNFGNTKTIYFH